MHNLSNNIDIEKSFTLDVHQNMYLNKYVFFLSFENTISAPAVPVESMLSMPMPPVGLQLVRDPNSGQLLFLPTATTIGNIFFQFVNLFISFVHSFMIVFRFLEPYQQAVVWPTYTQPHTSLPTASHLILPSLSTHQIQPPPLAPLLLGSSDYLAASTTVHQHTQSTRLVALASDGKRCKSSPAVSMPIHTAPTLVKVGDCSPASTTSVAPSLSDTSIESKNNQCAADNHDIAPQLSYFPDTNGNFVRIAPHSISAVSAVEASSSVNTVECRSTHSLKQILSPTSTVVAPSMVCNSSQSEQYPSRSGHDVSGLNSIPDVQDANIQTDTPLISEDDNTNGGEDLTYSSNVIINQPSLIEELNISVPTSTSQFEQCHVPDMHTEISSLTGPRECRRNDRAISRKSPMRKHIDINYESTVTSTNMVEEEHDIRLNQNKSNAKSFSTLYNSDRAEIDIHTKNKNQQQTINNFPENLEKEPTTSTPDLSGLELLSNSIEAFEKNSSIKQEPADREPSPVLHKHPVLTIDDSIYADDTESHTIRSQDKRPTQKLGGLNLLCALAEQRFQEEVGGSRSARKRSSSSDVSEPKRKKHKDKHASRKAKKRDRKDKKRRGSHLPTEGDGRDMVIDDILEKDLVAQTYEHVKKSIKICECSRNENQSDIICCCHGPVPNTPTAEEFLNAIVPAVRDHLLGMAREVHAQKRQLNKLKNRKDRRQRDSTPMSVRSSSSSSKMTVSVPTLSPSMLSTSSSDGIRSVGNDSGTIKIPSDSDSCSSTSSQQRIHSDLLGKKSNSSGAYILASKKYNNDVNFSTTDEASVNSNGSATLKRIIDIKQESFDFDDSSSQPDSVSNVFGGITSIAADLPSTNALGARSVLTPKEHRRKHCSSPKHHRKTKHNKERKKQRRSAEVRERKLVMQERCTLTLNHLDTIGDRSLRVLTVNEEDGFFYAGSLQAVNPPDIYAVTLDGERRKQSQIYSREEILRDWVSNWDKTIYKQKKNGRILILTPCFSDTRSSSSIHQ